jgi:opacity protein-like surface antigen
VKNVISKLLFTVAVVSSTAFAGAACAEDSASGWYGSARAGVALMNDPTFTFTDTATSDNLVTRLNTKNAFGAAGELGYAQNNFRFGVELSYEKHDVDGVTFISSNGVAITSADVGDALDALVDSGVLDASDLAAITTSGTTISSNLGSFAEIRQIGVMGNVAYDFDTGTAVKPYIMGGLGAVATHAEAFDEGDTVTRFAWQIGGGLAVDVASNVQVTADYRYRQVSGGDVGGFTGVDMHLGTTKSHFLAVGGRVRF